MNAKVITAWLALMLGPGLGWSATFVVNTAADSHDITPGDGVAGDHIDPDSSRCSLRAAIDEANLLAGPDTILVPVEIGPFSLRLGSLRLTDNRTVLSGRNGWPIIDGVGNLLNHASLIVESDSNSVGGFIFRRARGDGIAIFGADNQIGGPTLDSRVLFNGNGLDNENSAAVRITTARAIRNVVAGCYIGLSAGGMTPAGNRHGVIIEHDASENLVGGLDPSTRNLISGNPGYGVILASDAHHNQIAGCFIGPDSTGSSGPGNQLGGVILHTGARENLVGGADLSEGNLISANANHGIHLTGSDVVENTINGNMIGTALSGFYPLGNVGDGLLLTDGTHDNLIGGPYADAGNLISGNAGNGICLRGTGVTGNVFMANWVGPSLTGYGYVGNGWLGGDGLLIDSGAHHNTVGSTDYDARNVFSGNYEVGVRIDGIGTDHNLLAGNFIGVNATGTSSLGNAAGVVISGGAQSNTIGGSVLPAGNVISGNRSGDFPLGCGVLIFGPGTAFNTVCANTIGLDVTGYEPRRNGTCGVIIAGGAQYNVIGDDNLSAGNVISGNGMGDPIDGHAAGVHISGVSTRFNRVVGNLIGLSRQDRDIVGNYGHGVGIYSGASHNHIGGDSFLQTNQIVGNAGAGVFIAGRETESNLIRRNLISENEGLGIEIRDSAQKGIYPPTFVRVGLLTAFGSRYVTGRDAPPGARIDFYEVYDTDPSGSGEGGSYLASTYANANGFFDHYLPAAAGIPIVMTAISVDSANNCSEFAVNGYSPDATPVDEDLAIIPHSFELHQNYPNPFNATTVIPFSLPRASEVRLTVFNALGQRVRSLVDQRYAPGEYLAFWDGLDGAGNPVATGVYLYRLEQDSWTATRKMLLLK